MLSRTTGGSQSTTGWLQSLVAAFFGVLAGAGTVWLLLRAAPPPPDVVHVAWPDVDVGEHHHQAPPQILDIAAPRPITVADYDAGRAMAVATAGPDETGTEEQRRLAELNLASQSERLRQAVASGPRDVIAGLELEEEWSQRILDEDASVRLLRAQCSFRFCEIALGHDGARDAYSFSQRQLAELPESRWFRARDDAGGYTTHIFLAREGQSLPRD